MAVWVTTTNTISDVTIAEEGEHDIYLWLGDTAGNSRLSDPQYPAGRVQV